MNPAKDNSVILRTTQVTPRAVVSRRVNPSQVRALLDAMASGPVTEDGALELGGRLPINTSGGGLSEAYVHGFNLINEGVRQIRGSSVNQVKDAEACLVTAGEGVPTSALILRR